MDKDLLLAKLESLRRCLQRVQDKTPASADTLRSDVDAQDIIVLNLERAVQSCVDIGLHIVSGTEVPIPETMGQTFEALRRTGCLDTETAIRMIKAVGFRNTAVHAYQEIDWNIVYSIITEHLNDFRDFSAQVMKLIKP